jgi:hypothetical protein
MRGTNTEQLFTCSVSAQRQTFPALPYRSLCLCGAVEINIPNKTFADFFNNAYRLREPADNTERYI